MPFDPTARMLQSSDLQKMLEQIRQMMRAGARDAARQMLSQLRNMLENLRNARVMKANPNAQRGNQAMRQLQEMIRLFLAGKKFYGCNGLQLNDDIRVTIAAEACLLLLNRNTGIYPRLKHILVYPDAFQANHPSYNPDGTVVQGSQD